MIVPIINNSSSNDGIVVIIVIGNIKQIQIADHSHAWTHAIKPSNLLQTRHSFIFKENSILHCHFSYIHLYILTQNISLAANVLIIIITIVFVCYQFVFRIPTNVTRLNGFEFSYFPNEASERACVCAVRKLYSYVVRFHLFPFNDD